MTDDRQPIVAEIKGRKSLIKPPFSTKIRAGAVLLASGEAVGEHKTEGREEAIVVLSGTATVIVEGEHFSVPENHFAYIPPESVHNVLNETNEPLQYAYIVASVGKDDQAEHSHGGVTHSH